MPIIILIMKKFSFFLLCVLSFILTGCGVSQEAAKNINAQQTNINLSTANYRVIGQVEGKSKQFYFLCFGGLNGKSLQQSALSEMYDEAYRVAKGRSVAVINTTITYKLGFFIIGGQKTAIARGTLVEFMDRDMHYTPEVEQDHAYTGTPKTVPAPATKNEEISLITPMSSKNSAPKQTKDTMPKQSQNSKAKKTYKFGNIKFKENEPVKLQVVTLNDSKDTKIFGSAKLKSGFNQHDLSHPYFVYEVVLPNNKKVTYDDDDVKSVSDTIISWSDFEKLWQK